MIRVSEKIEDSINPITITNIIPNTGVPNYIRQFLVDMENQMSNNTVVMGDLNTSMAQKDKSSR